jgi:hypothetical protein
VSTRVDDWLPATCAHREHRRRRSRRLSLLSNPASPLPLFSPVRRPLQAEEGGDQQGKERHVPHGGGFQRYVLRRARAPSCARSFAPSLFRSFAPSLLRSFAPSLLRSFAPSRSFTNTLARSRSQRSLSSFTLVCSSGFLPSSSSWLL